MHAIQALKSALDRAMWSRVLVGAEGEVSRSEGGRSAGPDASDAIAGTEADGTSVRGGCERFADDGGGSKFLAWCWSMFLACCCTRHVPARSPTFASAQATFVTSCARSSVRPHQKVA